MAALAPDVILATGDSTVPPLLQATRTVPIVFPVASDPVGGGYVDGLARPGGNATGFMIFEYGMAGKWMELLKEITPNLTRVAVLHKLPAIYWERFFVTGGGLISYGPDLIDNYRRAAGYVDRILKGEKPADLPVQASTMAASVSRVERDELDPPQNLAPRSDDILEIERQMDRGIR